ncbi:MAG: tRNA 2-thiocytidine biosynthesis TtcA family protein [Selenomonadaceae bacterium]|nr:tRNA 2-thiocytidine biosynthesis TtcA family protein [Selenomonadaceae bacterium]
MSDNSTTEIKKLRPLPQLYFSKIMRAIVEFQLIEDGDRILVGLSGGKDSILLLYALATMRSRLKKNFELRAFTVNPQFSPDFQKGLDAMADLCRRLDVPYASREVDIAGTIAAQGDKDRCFTCAFFRRGAVNRYAKETGCSKVAYAHHHDDAVETLMMGLLSSGQISTFLPKTYLDKSDITVIRPLIYLREQEIIDALPIHGITPVKSPCPYDGHTKRQEIKELIARLTADDPLLYDRLGAALRESAVGDLWPRAKTRQEMYSTYQEYVKGQKG